MARQQHNITFIAEDTPMWTKPTYKNIRLGFEITMYFKSV